MIYAIFLALFIPLNIQQLKCVEGAWTYCIINKRDQSAAIGSCTCAKDKNSKTFFCASENGTFTASDRSNTHITKSSRGFLELSVRNGEKKLEKSCPCSC